MPLTELRKEEYFAGVFPSERSLEEKMSYGFICLDKPMGPSSHEVSSFVRKILGAKKTGHSGTLDANVSGVLPVLVNEACKTAFLFLSEDKEYVCVMKTAKEFTEKQLDEAFENFRGKIYQTPPLESAVKKQLRVREVYSLDILEVEGKLVLFRTRVQGGTYIRRLVRDVGEVLGEKTEMAELRRTNAAGFTEKECFTLQEIADFVWLWKEKNKPQHLEKVLKNIEEVLKIKRVVVGDDVLKPITTGANLALPGINAIDSSIKRGDVIGIFSGKGELAALATALKSGKEVVKAFEEGEMHGIAFDVKRVVHSFS